MAFYEIRKTLKIEPHFAMVLK